MVVRPRQHWLRMLFIWRGSVLPRILPQLATVTGIALLVTVLHGELFRLKVPLTFVPFTLIGVALAVFLGFRNSTSYDRYWEGRKLWGSVLGESRTLARQILTLPQTTDAARQRQLVLILVAITYSLLFWNQLVEVDSKGNVQPELAESWESKPGALEWTFNIRKGITFGSGKTLDADLR